jgi:hypothetical protein
VFFVENTERMVGFLQMRAAIRKAKREHKWFRQPRLGLVLLAKFRPIGHAGIIRNPLEVAYSAKRRTDLVMIRSSSTKRVPGASAGRAPED